MTRCGPDRTFSIPQVGVKIRIYVSLKDDMPNAVRNARRWMNAPDISNDEYTYHGWVLQKSNKVFVWLDSSACINTVLHEAYHAFFAARHAFGEDSPASDNETNACLFAHIAEKIHAVWKAHQ